MQIITTKKELQQIVAALKHTGKTIGLVPTMGALHEGHASLVRRAVTENDVAIVSVFVNPTQFNNPNDLKTYPRNLRKDAELMAEVGASFIFAPTPEEMYTAEEMSQPFHFDFAGLDQVMEGAARPGHFNGVVQVCSRLFYLAQPDRAYFGLKDFQQLAIIHHMVERSELAGTFGDLRIVDCPIVREPSGLARSSRNERLSDAEKTLAVNLSRVLFESREWAKTMTVAEVEQKVSDSLNAIEGLTVEYYTIVDNKTLRPTETFADATGCLTCYCCLTPGTPLNQQVRLIDNIQYANPD